MHKLSLVLATAAFALVVAGGTVTSTGSGDDVPTWPFPIVAFGIEMTHRHFAGGVGLLTLALAGWMLVAERRAWVRRLGVAAALLVLAQAGLGGARVLLGAQTLLAIPHAVIGQVFFVLVVLLALFMRPGWDGVVRRRPAVMLMTIVLIQLVLGAVLRHTQSMLVPHLLWAVVVVAAAIRVSMKLPNSPAMVWAWIFLVAQGLLGPAALFVRDGGERAIFGTAHVAVGAALLACSALLSFEPRRTEVLA